ncbi:hypothetical protein AADW59_00105 [Candidatus Hodgkinia cicadicola]
MLLIFRSVVLAFSSQFALIIWFSRGLSVHAHILIAFALRFVSFFNVVCVDKCCNDLDSFWFELCIANPCVIMVLTGVVFVVSAEFISMLWNQPLCWSAPSITRSHFCVLVLSEYVELASNQTSTTSAACCQRVFVYLLCSVFKVSHLCPLL